MPYDWIIFIGFILLLIYTMIVIKEEKSSFKENSVAKEFNQCIFHIPSWWGNVENQTSLLSYQRLDTRYEWEARFLFEQNIEENKTIEEDFKERIHALKVLFDPDSGVIMNPSDFNEHPHVQSGRCTIVRIEGMATQDFTLRRYLDAFLIRDHQTNTTLFATSMSSILNGLVEGPYFEEVMFHFDLG
jgi:hypothetical protein